MTDFRYCFPVTWLIKWVLDSTIRFIGTSLQLHLIMTARTPSERRLCDESLTNLGLIWTSRMQSRSNIATDRQSVSSGVHLRLTTRYLLLFYIYVLVFFFCGAPSLTRGRVCRLQLLLVLGRAVILRSKSRGTRDHIFLSQIRDFPFRQVKIKF
jgi:hypothetical protein